GVAPPPEGARGGTEPYTPEGGDGGPEARHRERGKGLFYANPRSQGTLAVLTGLLERGLGEASFRREPKLWRPHVTVGRLRDPAPVGEALETVAPDALKAPPFRISEIVLFRSRLHPGGAVHDVLERFPFLG
ncbi:MAG: 2'-5' RNA ligase family protein, partial [Actinomycetota bacterium]